jgi:hypothetical protein
MSICRGCGGMNPSRILDVSEISVAQRISSNTESVTAEKSSNPLAMDLSIRCVRAQQPAHDVDTGTAERRAAGVAVIAGEGLAR